MGDKEFIKNAVKEAMEEQLGQFFVEREQHYQDHCFVKDIRLELGKIQGTACKTVITSLIISLLSLIAYGIMYWSKKI